MALVSAVIPTRGDVPLDEVLDSLPRDWQKVVWDNSQRHDLGVYGRYAAIAECEHDLIWTQDDDVIVSDPQAIVDAWAARYEEEFFRWSDVMSIGRFIQNSPVVCNMPQEFRHDFYRDHALVGFGAVFHRDAPQMAFRRFFEGIPRTDSLPVHPHKFQRCCDIAFTALTPRVLVDVPKRNLPWADAPNRMWKQPTHQGERAEFLKQVLAVRDA